MYSLLRSSTGRDVSVAHLRAASQRFHGRAPAIVGAHASPILVTTADDDYIILATHAIVQIEKKKSRRKLPIAIPKTVHPSISAPLSTRRALLTHERDIVYDEDSPPPLPSPCLYEGHARERACTHSLGRGSERARDGATKTNLDQTTRERERFGRISRGSPARNTLVGISPCGFSKRRTRVVRAEQASSKQATSLPVIGGPGQPSGIHCFGTKQKRTVGIPRVSTSQEERASGGW